MNLHTSVFLQGNALIYFKPQCGNIWAILLWHYVASSHIQANFTEWRYTSWYRHVHAIFVRLQADKKQLKLKSNSLLHVLIHEVRPVNHTMYNVLCIVRLKRLPCYHYEIQCMVLIKLVDIRGSHAFYSPVVPNWATECACVVSTFRGKILAGWNISTVTSHEPQTISNQRRLDCPFNWLFPWSTAEHQNSLLVLCEGNPPESTQLETPETHSPM